MLTSAVSLEGLSPSYRPSELKEDLSLAAWNDELVSSGQQAALGWLVETFDLGLLPGASGVALPSFDVPALMEQFEIDEIDFVRVSVAGLDEGMPPVDARFNGYSLTSLEVPFSAVLVGSGEIRQQLTIKGLLTVHVEEPGAASAVAVSLDNPGWGEVAVEELAEPLGPDGFPDPPGAL